MAAEAIHRQEAQREQNTLAQIRDAKNVQQFVNHKHSRSNR